MTDNSSILAIQATTAFGVFAMPTDTKTFFETTLEPEWNLDDYISWCYDAFMAQLDDPTPLYYYFGMNSELVDPAERRTFINEAISTPYVFRFVHLALVEWLRSLLGGEYGLEAFNLTYGELTKG